MTGIDMVDCLQKFWTTRRVDIALAKLLADKVARQLVSGTQETNVLGGKLFFIIMSLSYLVPGCFVRYVFSLT